MNTVKTISMSEFKNHGFQYLSEDSEILLTKRGTPVAKIVPIGKKKEGIFAFGHMKGTVTIKGDIVGPIGE